VIDLPIRSETFVVEGRQGASRSRLIGSTTVPEATVGDLGALLDPTKWRRLTNGRITMTPRGGRPPTDGRPRLYQETFEITPRLRLTPLLRVVTKSLDGPPRARWLEYRLADDQSPGELLRVDQGSIFIRDVRGGVRVTATKRLLFAPPFDGPNLALLADPIGYFDAFETMVRAALPTSCRE
jgi:hypothetical protein